MSPDEHPVRDLVVVGGSAGAFEVLKAVLAALAPDLAAAVLVVLHIPAHGSNTVAGLLGRGCRLPVSTAISGQPLKPGSVHLAAADRHLLVDEGLMVLSNAPRQNRVRPAIDALFRSAARWYGARTIGVLLSGNLDDGAAGLAAIDARGGAAIVQEPATAQFSDIPLSGLAVVPHAIRCAPEALGDLISQLAGRPASRPATAAEADLIAETDMTLHNQSSAPDQAPGEPAGIGCPECGGGLSTMRAGNAQYYRCHVGHVYAPQALIAAQHDKAEAALWTVVTMLEEQATIHRHLAQRAESNHAFVTSRRQRLLAQELSTAAQSIRTVFPELSIVESE